MNRIRAVIALGAIVASTFVAPQADAQVVGGFRPMPGGRGGPGRGPNGPSQDVVTLQVNQNFYGFSVLDLTQLISYQIGGRPIMSVTVRMASQAGRGQATLLENGAPNEATVFVPQYMAEFNFSVFHPHSQPRLELRMNGQVFVQSVTVRTAGFVPPNFPPNNGYPPNPPMPGNPGNGYPGYPGYGNVISRTVNQYFTGSSVLNLDQLMNLQMYQGRRINRLTVRARSDAGHGTITTSVNGYESGPAVIVPTYSQDLTLFASGTIGYELSRLELVLRGRITIESVTIELQ